MCWCNPNIRTPNCGKPNCHPNKVQTPAPYYSVVRLRDDGTGGNSLRYIKLMWNLKLMDYL
jgi:hypothetical protein